MSGQNPRTKRIESILFIRMTDKNENNQPEGSSEVDLDIYSVPKLYCTICLHDLNHPIYVPCVHPILSVPLCVVCHEDVLRSDLFNEATDESDVCTWCGDGGDLLMCSDEEHCNRAFCKTCIESNFSANNFQSIENNDNWLCFCCDVTPLEPFKTAAAIAQTISIYNQSFSSQQEHRGEDPSETTETTENDQEIQRNLFLLQSVIEEGVEASSNLEDVSLSAREAEIRTELRETNRDPSVRYISFTFPL